MIITRTIKSNVTSNVSLASGERIGTLDQALDAGIHTPFLAIDEGDGILRKWLCRKGYLVWDDPTFEKGMKIVIDSRVPVNPPVS